MNRRHFPATLAAVPARGPRSAADAGIDPIKRTTGPRYLQQLRKLTA